MSLFPKKVECSFKGNIVLVISCQNITDFIFLLFVLIFSFGAQETFLIIINVENNKRKAKKERIYLK